MLILLSSILAFGQQVDAHNLNIVSNVENTPVVALTTFTAETHTAGDVGIAAVVEYGHKPLTLHSSWRGEETSRDVISSYTALNLALGINATKHIGIAVSTPVYLSVDGEGFGLGNTQFSVPVSLVSDDVFSLGVIPFAKLPGTTDYMSFETISGGALLSATLGSPDAFIVSTNVGMQFSPKADIYNLNGTDAMLVNIALGQAVTDRIGLGLELNADLAAGKNQFPRTESPIEMLGNVHIVADKNVGVLVGASHALNRGVGAPPFRLFAGVNVNFGKKDTEVDETPVCENIIPACKENKEYETAYSAGDVILLEPIHFDFDSDVIRMYDSANTLNVLVAVMYDHPEIAKLQIATGTDSRGNDAYNLQLSQRRADAIVKWLTEAGVDPNRLTTLALGERVPAVETCDTETCHEENRYGSFTVRTVHTIR